MNFFLVNAKRRLVLFVLPLFGILFMTTGCFDIEERVVMKSDNSGRYELMMDMTQMASLMEGFMAQEGEEGGSDDMFYSLDSTLQAMAERLKGVEGISGVSTVSEDFKFTIGYDFADMDALERAQTELDDEDNGMLSAGSGGQFKFDGKKRIFTRVNAPMDDVLGDDLFEGVDDEEGTLEMMKMFLQDAVYKCVYTMPGRIKKYSNEDAELSEDLKTITLEVSFLDLIEEKKNIGNEIKFKKK